MIHSDFLPKFLHHLKLEKNRRNREKSRYDWSSLARPSQILPGGNWRTWLILAGRGFGKTRTGAETLRQWIKKGIYKHIALIGETYSETRRVMVEGPSGLLSVHPPGKKPLYEPSKRQLSWPNGAIATLFSAQSYEHLRGPQFDCAWVDELAKFSEPQNLWDQLMFALRLGKSPRAIVTTTPRPLPLLKKLMKDPSTVLTKGSTFENAQNLAKPFLHYIKHRYGNSSLGRQELYAEILEKKEGSLWSTSLLEKARQNYQITPLLRVLIAIDPAVTSSETSDETGIIAAGITSHGIGVVLEDLSMKGPSHLWIQRAISAYHRLRADRIIAEVNMGGDLVEQLIRTHDKSISYRGVRALRGKVLRAEPIAALYEQGRVWHASYFSKLEKQMCSYVPGKTSKSPDRLDALVWALSDLMLKPSFKGHVWGG